LKEKKGFWRLYLQKKMMRRGEVSNVLSIGKRVVVVQKAVSFESRKDSRNMYNTTLAQ
jgi:hypothetical protein